MRFLKSRFKVAYIIGAVVLGVSLTVLGIFYQTQNTPKQAQASLFNPSAGLDQNISPNLPPRVSKIVPDQYIVKFKPGNNPEQSLNLKDGQNESLQIKTKLGDDTYLIENPKSVFKNNSLNEIAQAQTSDNTRTGYITKNTEETVKQLQSQSQIEIAEPNQIIKVDFTPDDTLLSTQWHLENTGQSGGLAGADIKAKQGWDVTQGSPSIIVAVIDTGVNLTHPDLVDKLARNGSNQVIGYNFANNTNDPSDTQGHGTHLAGIIAGKTNNTIGIAGVCPNCKIMPVKFMDNTGTGTTAAGISAINFAVTNGAKILNLSWGSDGYSASLQNAINSAYAAGVTVVASAGNSNVTDFQFPSDMSHVISVAATDRLDRKAYYSNYNNRITVSAPGSEILSTFPVGTNLSGICGDATVAPSNDGYGYCTGTSMAAPVVAGLAGLVASQNPSFNPDQIAGQIMGTSDNIDALNPNYKGLLGSGRVNAFRAVTETPKPMFLYNDLTVSDPAGNNNFLAQAGEDVNLNIALGNHWANASGVNATLSTSDSQVSLVQNTANYGNVNFVDVKSGLFTIHLDSAAVLPKTVNFSLDISSTGNANQTVNFSYTFKPAISVPNTSNFTNSSQDWNAGEIWHLSGTCPSGSTSSTPNVAAKYFHFGKDGCGNYDFGLRLNGSLYSPPINKLNPGETATLNFDQFLETEDTPTSFDKATVKIKTYGAADSTAVTLIAAQNNTTTWQNISVNLPNSITNAGLFQIFFNFDTVDNGDNAYKGWFVDNVKIDFANNITATDIPNLTIACDPTNYSTASTCRFTLPSGKSLPSSLKIQIQNSTVSAICTLDSTPNTAICLNVLTPNSVGVFPVSVVINNTPITTNQTIRVKGVDFSKINIEYTPNQGGDSPIFKSSEVVNIKLSSYKNIFDPAPTNNSYVCAFDFSTLGTGNWTSFGPNIPYDSVNGCQNSFTKALRGNNLNFDLRYKICPVATPDIDCSIFYDQYLYRFEGSGLAIGG
jgi:subtilisin family serine protease